MFSLSSRSGTPVPMLDGAPGPDDRLEEAPAIAVPAPQAMCVADAALRVSSACDVLRFAAPGAPPELRHRFDAPATGLAASPGGGWPWVSATGRPSATARAHPRSGRCPASAGSAISAFRGR